MCDLLKNDLKRVWKDKLFLIICIIASVFALITPLLFKGIIMMADMEELLEMEGMLGLEINAKMLFFNSFSLGNNFALVLPVLLTIVLCKDFSQGTIRNKIICGKSRTSIYFSLFITCAIYMCAVILAQAVLTLLVSLLFFDYQATEFTANDFGYLMASIGLEILVYLFVSAILVFMIASMKNAGLAIVMYFVINFVCLIVGSITQIALPFTDPTNAVYGLLEFLNNANVFATTLIGGGTAYAAKELLALILPNVLLTGLLLTLGLFIFRKKDLK